MVISRILVALIMLSLAGACDGPSDDGHPDQMTEPGVITAATLGAQVVLPTADYLKLPEYANADPAYGARLATQCRACHSFEQGGPSVSGPNLYGVFGRQAGEVDGYPYSNALAEADFIWTPEALDAWLMQPMRFLPGNRMAYPGLREQSDRNAVIAELLRVTDDTAAGDGQ
jgi:cytochrome c